MRVPARKTSAACIIALHAVISCARATDYFVDISGANGAFRTVQAAVDAVSGQTELNRANIFVAPGVYHESVQVRKSFVSIIGTGQSASAVKITAASTAISDSEAWGETFGLTPDAIGFMARNLTLENATPKHDYIQALAARSSADRAAFVGVEFLGFWDTLLLDSRSRAYLRSCAITGSADFIFGNATAVFDGCTIRSTDAGSIGAPNTDAATANGLIFLDCTLVSATDEAQPGGDGSSAENRTVNLSRPWDWWDYGIMPSATFIRTRMGPHITLAGWDPWRDAGEPGVDLPQDPNAVTRFSEFGSTDLAGNPLRIDEATGKPAGRAEWADTMTDEQAANYTLDNIFGPTGFWNAETQPQAGDVPYESQGPPWNVAGQLALLPFSAGPHAHALNMSTRLRVDTGENVMIAGFIVRGTTADEVAVRGLGPSLAAAGVDDALADPVLELRDASGALLRFNNSWKYSQQMQIVEAGLSPSADKEAALISTVAPGSYTAVLRGRRMTTGVGLAEIYDIGDAPGTDLVNMSTRGLVGTGDDVMIAGFILGNGSGTAKVLLRGIGPSLAQSGVASPLRDPTLTLRDSEGAVIAFNDDWYETQRAEIQAVGIPPTDEHESAIVATLPPGSYTAVLAGSDGGTGVGLAEVYVLE
jgi:hypothetical protein